MSVPKHELWSPKLQSKSHSANNMPYIQQNTHSGELPRF